MGLKDFLNKNENEMRYFTEILQFKENEREKA